jgi:hypothetical protein
MIFTLLVTKNLVTTTTVPSTVVIITGDSYVSLHAVAFGNLRTYTTVDVGLLIWCVQHGGIKSEYDRSRLSDWLIFEKTVNPTHLFLFMSVTYSVPNSYRYWCLPCL